MAESEDKIQIQVSAEGTAEAAKGLGQVTDALLKQQRTQEMIAKTSAQIQGKNRLDALKAEAKEINNVSAAFRTLATSAAPANDQLGKATVQFGQFRAASAAGAALVGNLGRSFVQLVPQAAGFQQAIQSSGMAMSQLLGVVGGGPGMIAAGVVGGIALLATYFAKAAEESEKLAEQTKKNAEELKAYLESINGIRDAVAQRFSASSERSAYEKKFYAGELSSKEYAAERQAAKEMYDQRQEIDKRVQAALKAGDRTGLLAAREAQDKILGAPLRGEKAREFEQAAREREKMQADNQAALDSMRGLEGVADADLDANKKATGGGYGFVSADAIQNQLKSIDQLMTDSRNREREAQAAYNSAVYADSMDRAQKQYESEKALRDKAFEDDKKRTADKRKMEERTYQLMQERNKAFSDSASNVAQIGANTTIKMFSDLAKGHKVALGAVLEGIGDQMVAEGTRVLFQAAAFAFIPGMQAAASGLAGVGAAEIAAGMTLGAAGARSEGGSNSGNGGQPAGAGPARGGTNYADPFANTARYGDSSSGPTIVNVTMPTVLTATAADGERIVQAVRKLERQRGVGL